MEPIITIRAIHNSGGQSKPYSRVVIHATCGGRGFPAESAAGVSHATAEYFTTPAAGGSAHYVEDAAREDHCIPDNVVAWHAPPNPQTLGIEICGEATYTRDQWLSPQVWAAVTRAAARTRELCTRFDIPVVKLSINDLLAGKRGICGHYDVSQAWHQSSHWDPGPGFPWDRFMAAVGGAAPVPQGPPASKGGRVPAWTLPAGNYYGLITGPNASHGGAIFGERPAIQLIQQALIRKHYAGAVSASWADGIFGPPTQVAVTKFQHAEMPGTTYFGQVWQDDWNKLLA